MSARACQGMLQYEAANGLLPPMPGDDPCIFTQTDSNGNYNGTYTVNTTMTRPQCGQAGGQWAPPGYNFQVGSDGKVQVALVSNNVCLMWGIGNWWVRGVGFGLIASGAGAEVGGPLTVIGLLSGGVQTAACAGGGAATF